MSSEVIADSEEFSIFRMSGSPVLEQAMLPITFSSWSETGAGAKFGARLLEKSGLTSILVTSKQNHWWHSAHLIDELGKIIEDSSLPPLLYGSSMGGYAALHFGIMFNADGIALSPQALVEPHNIPEERRWVSDRSRIKSAFDEAQNLKGEHSATITCFYDFSHRGDSLHRQIISDHAKGASTVRLVDVPYSQHTPVEALTASGILQSLVPGLCFGGQIDFERLSQMCSTAYRRCPKGLAHYLRTDHPHPKSQDFGRLLEFCEAYTRGDFEYHYMMAEAWARFGNREKALSHASEAERLNRSDYIILKRAAIMHGFGCSQEARGMVLALRADPVWSSLLEVAVTSGFLREA